MPDSATKPHASPPILGIVIPCYNEEAILGHTIATMLSLLSSMLQTGDIHERSFLMLVDDGSSDATWDIICSPEWKPRVRGIHLAHNAGHQQALFAGMMHCKGEVDCVVTLDADLQDDIRVVPDMVAAYAAGSEIVYGIRASRNSDTFFKRLSARLFYGLCRLLGLEIKPQHGDFRLLGRNALHALAHYDERLLFLRGIIPSLGFASAEVRYERKKRQRGETHYPFLKMLNLALEGITSFSVAPLRLIGITGALSLVLSGMYLVYALLQWIRGVTVPGWSSLIIVIIFFGSIQLISISILGEYIGKIYIECKKRPRYFIDKELK